MYCTPNTVSGLTPAELFLYWKPRTKLALLKPNLQADIYKKLNRQNDSSDKLRGSPRIFEVVEKVPVTTVRSEKISWVPGKILEKKGSGIYMVSILGSVRRCHADHMKVRIELDQEELVEVAINVGEENPVKASSPTRVIQTVSPQQPKSPHPQQESSANQRRSPQAESTLNQPNEVEVPTAVVQCSPATPKKLGRTVRKPNSINICLSMISRKRF